MKALSVIVLMAIVTGCTTVLPPSELEAIRAAGAQSRERLPHHAVGGYGTLAQAKALVATGESEEIDYWRLAQEPTADERADLRKAFDGAGGRAVQILGPSEKFVRRPVAAALRVCGTPTVPVLAAGTDRVMCVLPGGGLQWEKRGCGNVHCVQQVGNFIYYSNGSLYRVPAVSDKWANPQLVWRPEDVTGGGVLCFDLTAQKTLVFGVNSTCEVVEFDPVTAKVLVRFPVDVRNEKNETPSAHGRLRCVHKTAEGTYLVSCAEAAMVREYDAKGCCVKSLKTPCFTFDAVKRPNGNIVVSHVTGLTEYAPDGQAVWTLKPDDLPGLGTANFTALSLQPNGNLVVGTWANGASDASRAGVFEVTPEKRVVWALASSTDINMMSAVKLTEVR